MSARDQLLRLFLQPATQLRIRNALLRRCHASDWVDDCMQLTAEKLVRWNPAIPLPAAPLHYILGIARNQLFDRMGYLTSRVEVNECDLSEDDASVLAISCIHPERIAAADDELATVIRAVQLLSEQQRECFVMKKLYGYSHEEIAERLIISCRTVEQHLAAAACRLSSLLGREMRTAWAIKKPLQLAAG
jgi:RNA polymerase sigma factor (sigma-70 family)